MLALNGEKCDIQAVAICMAYCGGLALLTTVCGLRTSDGVFFARSL